MSSYLILEVLVSEVRVGAVEVVLADLDIRKFVSQCWEAWNLGIL